MAYTAVAVEGGLFPSDLLDRIASGEAAGQRPDDFGLGTNRRLSDEIQSAFSDARAFWDAFQRRRSYSRESSTTLTREGWIIPLLERLGHILVFQRSAAQIGDDNYAISHRTGDDVEAPPVHIVSIDQPLGQRVDGSRRSPHALVQEYLNRADPLWGIVTNGERLRLLRDSARLARPTYLEFDLRALVEGNLYSEFVLFYRLLHDTRFPRDSAGAHQCRLESYYQQGLDQGSRVREHLRDGVEITLHELGNAFLCHPDNEGLRDALGNGRLSGAEFYRQLLRLVYRLLFLLAVEERRLIFPTQSEYTERHATYTKYYSISRLRERCERFFADDHHADLWAGLLQTFYLFRDGDRASSLGLAALNGELFGRDACRDLEDAACENASLLRAMYHLSTFQDARLRRRVNYAALDVEELGSVYESLLDYRPQVVLDGELRFSLVAGGERRQSGSYYTPPELVRELIDHALVPVMDERLSGLKTPREKEDALLGLRVCDPASGSGHFLLAAARRIGRELARARTGEQEPPPDAHRAAVRDAIRHCIYAVDKNPLAVDLCKVALWLEGHNAGLPLSFLDHHVKCGDSLVGAFDLRLLFEGIPDEAYKATTREEKDAATYYRKRNKTERNQHSLEAYAFVSSHNGQSQIPQDFQTLATLDDRTPDDVHAKQELYESLRNQRDWLDQKTACDLWTAAFFLPLRLPDSRGLDAVPTTDVVRQYLAHPSAGNGPLVGEAVESSERNKFFHWHLEFPEVFTEGGFDVVLGNPPFMGGYRIRGQFGWRFWNYLTTLYNPARGQADLCAYFWRRAVSLLGPHCRAGMVATNTISQGDTREGGLDQILKNDNSIVYARRFIKWPGAANVEVNLLVVNRGRWSGESTLDGMSVPQISSLLDTVIEEQPKRLLENDLRAFKGSTIYGTGFILQPHEALGFIESDRRNSACLFPFLNGVDVNSRPHPSSSRWVINFFDWSLEEAKKYPLLLGVVEQKVKPEREKLRTDEPTQLMRRQYWWQYGRAAVQLYRAISPLRRVLVRSRVSETHALVFVDKGMVYGEATIVFAFDDEYHFALLQSNVHESWLRRNASTMRTDVRYTPTDCFDTFPFPQDLRPTFRDWADRMGTDYHEHRRQVMFGGNLGLTKTYNLFHQSECRDVAIQRLRELHAEMDRAVLACYGWQDLEPDHGFHQNQRGQTRFTISPEARREVLRRLLDLNFEIAKEEMKTRIPAGRPGR